MFAYVIFYKYFCTKIDYYASNPICSIAVSELDYLCASRGDQRNLSALSIH